MQASGSDFHQLSEEFRALYQRYVVRYVGRKPPLMEGIAYEFVQKDAPTFAGKYSEGVKSQPSKFIVWGVVGSRTSSENSDFHRHAKFREALESLAARTNGLLQKLEPSEYDLGDLYPFGRIIEKLDQLQENLGVSDQSESLMRLKQRLTEMNPQTSRLLNVIYSLQRNLVLETPACARWDGSIGDIKLACSALEMNMCGAAAEFLEVESERRGLGDLSLLPESNPPETQMGGSQSSVWSEMLADFQTFPGKDWSLIWTSAPAASLSGEKLDSHWTWLRPVDSGLRARASAMFLKAARACGYDNEDAWLDKLRKADFVRFECTGNGRDNEVGDYVSGSIDNVVEHSITLCYLLGGTPSTSQRSALSARDHTPQTVIDISAAESNREQPPRLIIEAASSQNDKERDAAKVATPVEGTDSALVHNHGEASEAAHQTRQTAEPAAQGEASLSVSPAPTANGSECDAATKVEPERPFPNRAVWLQARFDEREWTKHDLEKHGGPEHRTIEKILNGFYVHEDSVRKTLRGLKVKSAHNGKVLAELNILDIPND